jgi:hypothetical protein
MKSGQNVTGNLFKRLFNYFNTKRYEQISKNKEYKKDWDKVKWKIRVGKLAVLAGAVYLGKYFSTGNYNAETLNEKYMYLWEEVNSEVSKAIDKPDDFKQFYEELQYQLANYFNFELFSHERDVVTIPEGKVINRLMKHLLDSNNLNDNPNVKLIKVTKLLTNDEYESEVKEIRMKLE